MATNITSLLIGRIYIQSGYGVPTHISDKGSLFFDLNTSTEYINKDGLAFWAINVDSTNIAGFFTGGTTSGATVIFSSITANTIFATGITATTISAATYLGITTDDVTNLSNITGATATDALNATTVWRGNWVQDVYLKNQQVLDNSFLAIANKTTEDRPLPQPIGAPSYVYSGSITSTTVSAKQIIFGNRYSFDVNMLLEGWRVNVIAGNNYNVFLVQDPTGVPVISQIINLTAQNSGWVPLNIAKTIIASGSTYDLVVVVSEPDPTPTTFSGNWNYLTPTNSTVPTSGQIVQANKLINTLRIHKFDNAAVDRTAQLSALTIGDIITVETTRWAIQSSTDSGTYFSFVVSPETQLASDGVKNFLFEVVSVTPITYPLDPSHWTNFPPLNITVQGLLGVDIPYFSIVPNGTAYGVDILVREVIPSPDWDLQAFTSDVSSNGGIANLQSAYDNSTAQPQITLTSALGGLQIKGVTGPNNIALQILNSGSTPTIHMSNGGGISATTISATTYLGIPTDIIFNWRYDTSTIPANPGSGDFRANNSVASATTQLFISDICNDINLDMSTFFSRVSGNWLITIQQANDASKFVQFTSPTGYTDNTGWWTLPVNYVQSSGTPFITNAKCSFMFVNQNGPEVITGTTFQIVYNNSTQPQVSLSSVKGSMQIKGYDGPNSLALQILNSGATPTIHMSSGGGITANTISAVTISATTFISGGTDVMTLINTKVSTGTTLNINGNSYNLSTDREWRVAQGDTGVLLFSGLSAHSATTINIGPVTGYIINNESNPLIPTYLYVTYSGGTGIPVTTLSAGTSTYVFLNSGGTIVFQTTFPTSADRKSLIWLGKVGHPTGTITTVINEPDYITSPQAFSRDLFQVIGPYINDNVYPYANGANLNFNITSGNIHGDGINFTNNRTIPNEIAMGPYAPTPFLYRTQTGGTFTATFTISAGTYDVGGAATPVGGGANSSTIQYIFAIPGIGFIVQFGQTVYGTLADAVASVGREGSFIVFPNLIGNTILIGVLAVNKNATALNDTAQARFFPADKFGQIIGSTAGIATGSLQSAYDNSGTPEIVTNAVAGALTLRTFDGPRQNIFEGQTSGGTTTFAVNANGDITGTTISLSGTLLTSDLVKNSGMLLSTGAYEFSGISATTSTLFNVGAAKGYIMTGTTPGNVGPVFVNYSGATGLTTPFLSSSTATYFMLTTASTLSMSATEPTVTQRRQNIYLGVIGHPSGALTGAGNRPDLMLSTMSQVRDMFKPIRFINDGVICYAGTGMTMANSAGTLYGLGIGFVQNGPLNPTTRAVTAALATTFQYRTQTGGTFTNTTTISAATYDVGGIATTITGTTASATNQRIYLLENGNIRMQFGQTIYVNLAAAISAAQTESFTVFSNFSLGVLIGILSVTSGCTSISDTNNARFLSVSKFGETVGAAGGIAVGTLQNTYNNSSHPEITTNSGLGALTLIRGSLLDSDSVLEIKSGANVLGFSVDGYGGITGSSISATTYYNLPPADFSVFTSSTGTYSIKANNDTAVIASGNYAVAEGSGTTALGIASHAEGGFTKAIGNFSHAEGSGTTASGITSHSEGSGTTAVGNYSHSEGNYTTAFGIASHSEGFNTKANGIGSHAEGSGTTSIGDYSHVEGFGSITSGHKSHSEGNLTTAIGVSSHAEGELTVAFGVNSHAEGIGTTASGYTSHAEGYYNWGFGYASHAEGYVNIAQGDYSHAEGQLTTALGLQSHAGGISSIASGVTSFIHSTNSIAAGARSAVIGGQGIIGLSADTVYVPFVNVQSATTNNALTQMLARASDGTIQLRDASTFGSGGFSGGSGNCIADLYVTNFHGCSPITVHDGLILLSGLTANTFTTPNISAGTVSATTYLNLPSTTFTGGTVTGATLFNNGLSANTISATTYLNLPVTAGFSGVTGGTGLHSIEANNDSAVLASGPYSFAEGSATTATGHSSHAEGSLTVALGDISHAEGSGTTTLFSGLYSHAEGAGTTASGTTAHAEGSGTTAIGLYSHAEGTQTTAMGMAGHAEGLFGRALGLASHAEGQSCRASGINAHAEGNFSTATGNFSHAEGSSSTANGLASHAENLSAIAEGNFSHAGGSGTTATGNTSFIHSSNSAVWGTRSVVLGGYNITGATDDTVFVPFLTIKSATTNNVLTTLLAIDTDGTVNRFSLSAITASFSGGTVAGATFFSNGLSADTISATTYLNLPVTAGFSGLTGGTGLHSIKANNDSSVLANGNYSFAEGNSTTASGSSSHAEGQYTKAWGNYSHAEGSGTTASGASSHAEGSGTTAVNLASHAEGLFTKASGVGSHAEGRTSIASGLYSHAEGIGSLASGAYSHSEGNGTFAINVGAHAEGAATYASGTSSHAEGEQTTATGDASHAEGIGSMSDGFYSHAEGYYAQSIGIGAHAEGYATVAEGDGSHVEGDSSSATGQGSHAEGYGTIASGFGSHSEGSNTLASGDYGHAGGVTTKAIGSSSYSEGELTTASGQSSHAEGRLTTAIGNYSHTEGVSTKTLDVATHAGGSGSTASGSTSFIHSYNSLVSANRSAILGGFNITGTTDDTVYVPFLNVQSATTNNALTTLLAIASNGTVNRFDISSLPTGSGFSGLTGGTGLYSIKVNNDTVVTASGNYSFAEGSGTTATGFYSHAEGQITTAIGIAAHAEGAVTKASGTTAHAEGSGTTAMGLYSHSQGYNTIAMGTMSHAEGEGALAQGYNSHAQGNYTTARGNFSHAEGSSTLASGQASHSMGTLTIASGNNAFAGGSASTATTVSSFIHSSNSIVAGTRSAILGGYGIVGNADDTVYVPLFNIQSATTNNTNTSLLGIASDGSVSRFSLSAITASFSGGSVANATYFTAGLSADTFSATTIKGITVSAATVSATTLSASTIRSTSVSAVTISATTYFGLDNYNYGWASGYTASTNSVDLVALSIPISAGTITANDMFEIRVILGLSANTNNKLIKFWFSTSAQTVNVAIALPAATQFGQYNNNGATFLSTGMYRMWGVRSATSVINMMPATTNTSNDVSNFTTLPSAITVPSFDNNVWFTVTLNKAVLADRLTIEAIMMKVSKPS